LLGHLAVESTKQVAEFTANESSFNPFPGQMCVRCKLFALIAALALLLGACSRDSDPLVPEPDDAAFREGQQKLREGRHPEALTWFLKVIDQRGAQNSPESHLEAGRIYLQYIKDPIKAYYHFSRYLELQPSSTQAVLVRGKMDEAKREFATRLPLRPEDNQVRFENAEELERLRKENAELRAQLATLQGGTAVPVTRSSRVITAPDFSQPVVASAPIDASPITAPPPRAAAPAPVVSRPTPQTASVARSTTPPANAPRTTAPARAAPSTGGRTHTVGQGESAWAIARKYYGASPTALQVQALLDANNVTGADLKPGMTLRVP
jgi:tetratricopeptide (TPR) repeat protein